MAGNLWSDGYLFNVLCGLVYARRGLLPLDVTRVAWAAGEFWLRTPMRSSAPGRSGARCRRVRSHLSTFLDHPEAPADNSSERELQPTATYRKVNSRFRSDLRAGLVAAVGSVIAIAARCGVGAYQSQTAKHLDMLTP